MMTKRGKGLSKAGLERHAQGQDLVVFFLFISWQSKICALGILNAVHLENAKT